MLSGSTSCCLVGANFKLWWNEESLVIWPLSKWFFSENGISQWAYSLWGCDVPQATGLGCLQPSKKSRSRLTNDLISPCTYIRQCQWRNYISIAQPSRREICQRVHEENILHQHQNATLGTKSRVTKINLKMFSEMNTPVWEFDWIPIRSQVHSKGSARIASCSLVETTHEV